jgi:hypothetical protein
MRIGRFGYQKSPIIKHVLDVQSGYFGIYTQFTRCWLQHYKEENPDALYNEEEESRIDWLKNEKLLWFVFPLVCFAVAAIIQSLILTYFARSNTFNMTLYQVANACFYCVHVELAYQLFTSVACIEFQGKIVLFDDLTRECFEDDEDSNYLFFLTYICAPTLLLYYILIPIVNLIVQ